MMSGKHGLSLFIPGGVNADTVFFSTNSFLQQLTDELLSYGISWIIIPLSTPHKGDQYLAPHSYLSMNHFGSTPRLIPSHIWNSPNLDVTLYPPRDLFAELLMGLHPKGITTLARMAAEGPSLPLSGESAAYDYRNASPFVDSCTLCPGLTGTPYPFCDCAPSVHLWRGKVRREYDGRDDAEIMRVAYAELIVEEYAARYKDLLGGFVFDQGEMAEAVLIEDIVREYIPEALLSFHVPSGSHKRRDAVNMDFVFAPMAQPASFVDDTSFCGSYPSLLSLENDASHGFFPNHDSSVSLLGHLSAPINTQGGSIAWNIRRAQEWQARALRSGGAWTWEVKRGSGSSLSYIDQRDVLFLRIVYEVALTEGIVAMDEGTLKYKCEERSPTVSPTVSVMPTVGMGLTQSNLLMADFGGDIYMYGNMFDVEAMQNVILTGLDIKAADNSNFPIKVYTRIGTYRRYETSVFGWNLLQNIPSVTARTRSTLTTLPDFPTPISVPIGAVLAFYVVSTKPLLLGSAGETEGTMVSSDAALKLYAGTVNFPNFGVFGMDYTWNGGIRYQVLSTPTPPPVTLRPTTKPTASPTPLPTPGPTTVPTPGPTTSPTRHPSAAPTRAPTKKPAAPTEPGTPTSYPTQSGPGNAAFMSGKHGIGLRITGGVNYATVMYDVNAFIIQMMEELTKYGVSWVILTLSTSFTGDRFLAPHSVLTEMNPGSTPKEFITGWNGAVNQLEEFDDRDIFREFLDGLWEDTGIKVIAYLATQGPALLVSGPEKAYDYNRLSPYVESCFICPDLTGTPAPFCACAPSVIKWKAHVKNRYGSSSDTNLQRAYAEIIVDEFAERYKDKLAGFWFDNGDVADMPALDRVIRQHMPNAAVAYNKGQRNPLRNNNPPYEDYTFGYPHHDFSQFPPWDCENYPAVTSLEETASNGYFLSEGHKSLGHIYTPVNRQYNSGNLVWRDTRLAQEWMSRVLRAGGAWTWAVKRATGNALSAVDINDIQFLAQVYSDRNFAGPYTYTCS